MELHIVTPQKTLNFSIAWLELNSSAGSYIIQPGHAPMILSLSKDKPLFFRLKNGKQESITISHTAIAHVDRQSTTIILSQEL